ncbi:hypothetical protein HZC35_03850 [Candidatus Saganbacteria bacterium]|nr:hypothetical protein [Candidatus Saganbacteria bacterium]
MKKYIALLLLSLFVFSFTLSAFAEPLPAADRVKNMANEETGWRYMSAGGKMFLGGLLIGTSIGLWQAAQSNVLAAMGLIPLSVITGVPGVLTFGWGTADLFFGSREYENEYDKLKLAGDTDRENQAALYLKEKAEKDKKDRQPSFWNAFGLLSMFPTPAEREYSSYLKDRGQQ